MVLSDLKTKNAYLEKIEFFPENIFFFMFNATIEKKYNFFLKEQKILQKNIFFNIFFYYVDIV